METGIIQSALFRLGMNGELNQQYAGILAWGPFLTTQLERLIQWSYPLGEYNSRSLQNPLLALGMLLLIIRYSIGLDRNRRIVMGILTFSGALWLIGMRHLSAFHDYTAMYYLGFIMAFYLSILSLLRIPSKFEFVPVILVIGIFLMRNSEVQAIHQRNGSDLNAYTYDLMRINEEIPRPGTKITLLGSIPNAPYSPGYLLSKHVLAPLEYSDYVISTDSDFASRNLTPENLKMYLFANK
jgi:hypothetical protein